MIYTDRLSIKETKIEDAPFIFELLNSPTWIQFIGDRGIKSNKDAETYIKNSLIDSYTRLGHGLYKVILLESARPLGLCGLLKRDYLDLPDLGFAILPEHEGKGYTYEAALAVLNHTRETLEYTKISAFTKIKNLRSQNLLTKLEFQLKSDLSPLYDKSMLYYELEL